MLSSRLMALVIPISQKMASAMLRSTEPVHGRRQAVVNNEGGAENLSDQFLIRLDVDQVVNEADEKQESAREQDLVFRK